MEVKIYTTPTCPWSKKALEWLEKNKQSYQECDTSESSLYRDELLEKTGQMSMPVFDIKGQIIVGFHPEKIKEAVEKAKSMPSNEEE